MLITSRVFIAICTITISMLVFDSTTYLDSTSAVAIPSVAIPSVAIPSVVTPSVAISASQLVTLTMLPPNFLCTLVTFTITTSGRSIFITVSIAFPVLRYAVFAFLAFLVAFLVAFLRAGHDPSGQRQRHGQNSSRPPRGTLTTFVHLQHVLYSRQ